MKEICVERECDVWYEEERREGKKMKVVPPTYFIPMFAAAFKHSRRALHGSRNRLPAVPTLPR